MTATMPTIRTARYITKKGNLDGVLIVGFGDGSYSTTTYGATVKQCAALKKLNEFVSDAIQREVVDLSEFEP